MSPYFAYVGSRTTRARNARGEGISVYRIDPSRDAMARIQLVSGLNNPSFLAVNQAQTHLYCVHGDDETVSAFAIHTRDGTLRHLQTEHCGGRNPVHLALDPSGQFLVVANHLSGSVGVLPIQPDGTLAKVSHLTTLTGSPGPHRIEQPFSKPHATVFDPSGKFLAVPDKGLDRVFMFRFEQGALASAASSSVATREGAGPRHIAFHPHAPLAYVINELDSTVVAYRFNCVSGALTPLQIRSSLCDTFTGNSRAAEIGIDRSGKFLYASNRGADSITVFSIHPQNGRLTFVASFSAGGITPRHFALSPDQQRLFVLNEDSDAITVFGGLSGGNSEIVADGPCGSPVCIVFKTDSVRQ
jgi:6-phosphogluconolactonase